LSERIVASGLASHPEHTCEMLLKRFLIARKWDVNAAYVQWEVCARARWHITYRAVVSGGGGPGVGATGMT
jgi:hypothetical protein